MSAKDTILRRIHTALRDVPPAERPEDVRVARDYRLTDDAPRAEIVQQFAERVAEYKAAVRVVREADLVATIAAALRARGISRLVVPAGLPEAWLPPDITPLRDTPPLSHTQLDTSEGVITSCALGIAQTGTIVLDHGLGQGRRALSLLPDYHLCIVRAAQVIGLVPEAIGMLDEAAHAGRPLTFISGPSATSDIELNRVEGVHGPRTLEVIVIV
ncbi:MAG: LUD domain-containing protein [Roseiflexaceae bacterium]|nr:LUD domain-containing protein [Roseiflexaceae bacterium]